MKDLLGQIRERAEQYRSVPFWSLNDKLEPEMLREQIRAMKSAGIGGFFMHARGGLETEYMSEDWLQCIEACVDEADKVGMDAWAYDENGWPSGFADGVVPAKGFAYQQKWLAFCTCEGDFAEPEHVVGYYRISADSCARIEGPEAGALCMYIGYNRYYIDVLSRPVLQYFLEVTHEKYFARCGDQAGKAWRGFFTDEPQYSSMGPPWTLELPALFREKYGYDLLDCLPAIGFSVPGCEKVRNDFWSLVAELFTDAFGKQIYDWCEAHGLEYTGHMMCENNLQAQMGSTSGCMQFYPFFHMPGMDHLGRHIESPIQPKQVGSVAEQLGRRALTETFALCGWDVSWEELKWIAEWQYVNGINVTCQHLEPYSLRGLRKRDYPPAMFIQQSWFQEYKYFNDYFARLGALLQTGRTGVEVLMLHPIRSAYVVADRTREALQKLDEAFLRESCLLSDLHIDYHYGDEAVMAAYAKVSDGALQIGRCAYRAVVLPTCCNMSENTYRLLADFAVQGGRIVCLGEKPNRIDGVQDARLASLLENVPTLSGPDEVRAALDGFAHLDITENGRPCGAVHYCSRILDNGEMVCFLVNHDEKAGHTCAVDFGAEVSVRKLDLGELTEQPIAADCAGRYTVAFAPMQSYVFVVSPGQAAACGCGCGGDEITMGLADTFTVKKRDLNALTLDRCDYRVDGGEWVSDTPIIVLQRRLLELRRPCDIELRLKFTVEATHLTQLYACVETPELFSMQINGQPVSYQDGGYFIDSAFKKIDILPYVRQGENVIELSRSFAQKQKVYDMLFGVGVHETELNKLTYDAELESVYILGDFDVYSLSGYTYGERKATFTDGPFVIRDMGATLRRGDFGEQGLRFFSGLLTVAQTIRVQKQPGKRVVLRFAKPWAPLMKLYVNGQPAKLFAWADYAIDLTDLVRDGENELAFELFASNRNLLGPHHNIVGESYFVGPSTFSNVPGWADPPGVDIWKDSYCFVRFGLEG